MARVPEDRALRRKVTQLRYRAFDAEAERDRGEFATALEHGASLVKEAASLWPASHAEALYLLGTTQAQGGDTRQSIATLRDAAAIAETAHQDYTAANAWIQLASGTTFDEGAPARGLEYVRYAEAANDRLGKPADVTVLIEYVKGSTLVEANRHADAEVALRHAVELAETIAPDYLPQAIQGLGYLYEDQGRYRDAVEAYRSALGKLPATGPGVASSSVIFRVRLAANLSSLGRNDEALAMGREAVTIADRTLPTDTIDRAAAHVELAQLLASSGLLPEALAEAQRAAEDIANNAGERNARYGEALAVVASILENQGRFAEADEKYARACEIVAFATAELSSQHAECLLDETGALEGMHRQKHALAVLDKILPVLEKTYPGTHPQIANAYVQRGSMHAMLGHHALALADLERAVAMFGAIEIDPGHLASARWALAQELWDRDPVRAKTLLAQARATLATAGATWARPRRDADEFAAAHAK